MKGPALFSLLFALAFGFLFLLLMVGYFVAEVRDAARDEFEAPVPCVVAFGLLFILAMACFFVGLLLSKPNRKGPARHD